MEAKIGYPEQLATIIKKPVTVNALEQKMTRGRDTVFVSPPGKPFHAESPLPNRLSTLSGRLQINQLDKAIFLFCAPNWPRLSGEPRFIGE
jgi:hypothetical protein